MQDDGAALFNLAGCITDLALQGLQGIPMVASLFASRGLAALMLAIQQNFRLVCMLGLPPCTRLVALKVFALAL